MIYAPTFGILMIILLAVGGLYTIVHAIISFSRWLELDFGVTSTDSHYKRHFKKMIIGFFVESALLLLTTFLYTNGFIQ